MKMPARYEIDRIVSADTTRPALTHAYLNTDARRLIATDGHVMAVLPVEIGEHDVSGFVSVDAIKAARKSAPKGAPVEIAAIGALAVKDGPTFPRPGDGLRFPQYEQVLPSFQRGDEGTVSVALNLDYLLDLAQAIGAHKSEIGKVSNRSVILTLKTESDGRFLGPIVVEKNDKYTDTTVRAVLMPETIVTPKP